MAVNVTEPARDALRFAQVQVTGPAGRRVSMSETLSALVAAADWDQVASSLRRLSDQTVDSAATSDPVEAQIRAAYGALTQASGSKWVGLVTLRKQLPELSRDEVDAALVRLSRQPGGHVQAEANQSALTAEDWDAAVTFGGSTRHLLKLE